MVNKSLCSKDLIFSASLITLHNSIVYLYENIQGFFDMYEHINLPIILLVLTLVGVSASSTYSGIKKQKKEKQNKKVLTKVNKNKSEDGQRRVELKVKRFPWNARRAPGTDIMFHKAELYQEDDPTSSYISARITPAYVYGTSSIIRGFAPRPQICLQTVMDVRATRVRGLYYVHLPVLMPTDPGVVYTTNGIPVQYINGHMLVRFTPSRGG